MRLPNTNNEIQLTSLKNKLIQERYDLLQDFRVYAVDLLHNRGKTFRISCVTINVDENLEYKNLQIGENILIASYDFKFNPISELMVEYERLEFIGVKQSENIDDFFNAPTTKVLKFRKPKRFLTAGTEFESKKITEVIQNKADKIVSGIFEGKISFDDDKFRELLMKHVQLKRKIAEINGKLNSYNQSFGFEEEQQKKL